MIINQEKIAIITSKFNEEITQRLYKGAIERFKEKGIVILEQDCFFVPGAVEIPLVASRLAATKQYDAILCFGAVIQGETDHYDYVCWQVSYGCQKVAINYGIPVIFGVLTTQTEEQAYARVGGGHSHKGIECADAALEMISVMRSLDVLNVNYKEVDKCNNFLP